VTAKRIIAIAATALALALPASASAWQLKFSHYFQLSGVSGQAQKLVARKCSGGKFGNYILSAKSYILIQDSSSDLYVALDMDVKLPVFTEEKKLHVKHFELTYTGFPDEAADEIHDSLVKFFNMSHTKLTDGGKMLQFKQNGLELAGTDVIDPGVSSAPFKPKPGC
jgi:hypothetical protein